MKTTRLALLLFFSLAVAAASAQSARAYEKAGDKAFAEKDYFAASVHFREAMNLEPESASLWFKFAEVARQFNAFEEAEKHYAKVVASESAANHPMAAFWLGQVQKCLGKYREASESFQAFLKMGDQSGYFSQWATEELEACKWAVEAPAEPDGMSVQVQHLDKKINTPFSEFGAVQVGSTLYYSSFRYDYPDDSHRPERKLTKVLTSEGLAKGKLLGNNFNDEAKHTAHTAFSTDGQRMYFTLCEYVSSSDIRCQVMYRQKDKRGRWDKQASPLPATINLKGYTATQPTVGFDSIAQQEVLFFVSDRPGGKGKLDIWYCALAEGKFLEPKPLEEANTPENDISPFFHGASQTLSFSTDGRAGLGGYDVYAMKRSAEWGQPTNLGRPINSSYHDIYFSRSPSAKEGFLSSNRPGSFYLDPDNKACCHDLYKVSFEPKPPPVPGAPVVPPVVVELPPAPPTFEKLEDFLPLALYFDNDEPDKRTSRTTTKKSYPETYEKFYPRKPDFLTEYTKPIKDEEEADEARLRIADFFESEVKKGYDHLGLFSEILRKRLEQGDRVEIVIRGYTSPRAKSDYNDNLAKRRISSLRNHFETYKDGIFESYIKHGKLVISEAPFGETQAATGISDDLFDERNSIYSVGASRERRVEIIEVK